MFDGQIWIDATDKKMPASLPAEIIKEERI
jgi:hypothetical protein